MFFTMECLKTADPSERPVIAESCLTSSSAGHDVSVMANDTRGTEARRFGEEEEEEEEDLYPKRRKETTKK